MKRNITILFVCLVALLVFGIIFHKPYIKNQVLDENINKPNLKEPVSLCYLYSKETPRKFYDEAWLELNIIDDQVTGQFYNVPAEKDRKTGDFEGTVGPLDQAIMGRRATLWWNASQEGMSTTEELEIVFGDGSANVFFGEMVDRGDGIYIYKDKTSLTPGPTMSQISCESLDEKIFVEKYLRDNIKDIVPDQAVLGGSWYAITVNIEPYSHAGSVIYEDGHIQGEADFSYEYNKDVKKVIIKNFEIRK